MHGRIFTNTIVVASHDFFFQGGPLFSQKENCNFLRGPFFPLRQKGDFKGIYLSGLTIFSWFREREKEIFGLGIGEKSSYLMPHHIVLKKSFIFQTICWNVGSFAFIFCYAIIECCNVPARLIGTKQEM